MYSKQLFGLGEKKRNTRAQFPVRWVNVRLSDPGCRWHSKPSPHNWPRLQPCPGRKSVKARLSYQPWPWLQRACTRPDRGHPGSPIRGMNPRTNEQVCRDWEQGVEAGAQEELTCSSFLSILHAALAACIGGLHWCLILATNLNGHHWI